jgi:hypothetical protein
MLISMPSMASASNRQRRWRDAGELDKQVIEARKRVIRSEHPDTLASMNGLACT